MALELRDNSICFLEKDLGHEVEIVVSGAAKCYQQSQFINRDQAIEVIEHLKEQFGL